MLKRSQPIFAVHDIRQTVDFYQNTLGFGSPWFWGEPVNFAGIHLGDIHVMFHQQPHIAAHIEGHEHHYWTDDIQSLHDQHAANHAPIISPIDNKPWGLREYTIRDPNGYHLRFSGPLEYHRPPNALSALPDHIRIESRLPTFDEYCQIKSSVGGDTSHDSPQTLARSHAGIVAVDSRNQLAVAMARIHHEAHAWYSIWDVNVRPDYQSQRIGSAVVSAALNFLRSSAPPGSIVFLFTFKHPFYQKLGFHTDTCSTLRL